MGRPCYTLLIILSCLSTGLQAQTVYTLRADSVKITNCDSAELILENHTQNIPGFLFNTGNGRTIFKRGAQPLGNGAYLIGGDTLNLKTNAWVQGGNAFGTTGILGTQDSNHLDLYTNNTLQARLTADGNLLLGSTWNSGSKLYVGGNATFSGTIFQTPGVWTGLGNGLAFDGNGTTSSRMYTNTSKIIYTSRSEGDQHLFLNDIGAAFTGNLVTIDPGPYALNVNQLSLRVNGEGGNIGLNVNMNGWTGIGTMTPTAQLHTTGSVCFAGLTADATQTRVLVADASGNLYCRDASSLAANDLIRSSLAVNGTITAKKLRLTEKEWPDYVFKKEYRLPTLATVEKYINQNHHLPGITAAAEVEKQGVDVGDNQAALLKKVEELTLYVIEQNKKLEAQNKKIETLSREISKLKRPEKIKH